MQIESNQYFAPALALNPHYANTVAALFGRESAAPPPGGAGGGGGGGGGLPLSSLDMFGALSPTLLRPVPHPLHSRPL